MLRLILSLLVIGVVISVTMATYNDAITDKVAAKSGQSKGTSADQKNAADGVAESCDPDSVGFLGGTGSFSADVGALAAAPSGAEFVACADQVCPDGKTFTGCAYKLT